MMDVTCYNVYCRCMLFPRDAPDVKGKSRLVNYYALKVIDCEEETNIRNLCREQPAPCTIFRNHSQFPHHPGSLRIFATTIFEIFQPKVSPQKKTTTCFSIVLPDGMSKRNCAMLQLLELKLQELHRTQVVGK